MNTPSNTDPKLISYNTLRKSIGLIGILLPVVLGIGAFFIGMDKTLQPSISDYYFTTMGDALVGALCAVALFLFCYKGNEPVDGVAANLAAFFAIIVALFPTSVDAERDHHMGLFVHVKSTGIIHYSAAALLFLILAYFCLFLFRKTQKGAAPTRMKLQRNRLYLVCGIIMVCCVALIPVFLMLPGLEKLVSGKSTYIFETVALWAFGLSWLTKGEAILGD